jgi:hypothetical protein
VYRIWSALNEAYAEANTSATAGDLCTEIDWVDTTDTVAEARLIMGEENYSPFVFSLEIGRQRQDLSTVEEVAESSSDNILTRIGIRR